MAPTCGAVVAAAVIMPPNCHRIPGVRDSKTLTALQRERLAPIIRRRAIAVGRRARRRSPTSTGSTSTTRPTSRCAARSPGSAATTTSSSTATGSPTSSSRSGRTRRSSTATRRVYSIACASVVAKIVRDRMMAKPPCPLPGVRLGPQPGLRDAGAPGRDPGARPDAAPPPRLAGDPGPARGRPARAVRRAGAGAASPTTRSGSIDGCARRWPTMRPWADEALAAPIG